MLDTIWPDDESLENAVERSDGWYGVLEDMMDKYDADAWLWEEDDEYEEPFQCPDGFVDDRF